MFGTQGLNELQLRKRALLLESELNRLAFRVESERLREVGSWANRLASVGSVIRSWTPLLGTVAGIAVMLGPRGRSSRFGKLSQAILFIKPLMEFWRTRIGRSKEQ